MAIEHRPGATQRVLAPLWPSVVFLTSLVALYLGQRVIVKWEAVATALSGAAVLASLAATVVRFGAQRGAAAGQVTRLLGGLQGLGLLSLALFFMTTDAGASVLGLSWQSPSADEPLFKLHAAGRVVWVIGLSISVMGLVFAEVALHPMRAAVHVEAQRVWAAAASGVTLALAASYGALFVYAASEQEAQADFSYFKTSKPGEATVKLAQRASEKVRVTAFFPEVSQVRKEVAGYLNQLAKVAPNVEVKLADRYLEPALATELKVVSDGVVVLSQEDSHQTLSVGTDLAKARAKLMKFDSEFYGKLSKLITSRRTAYWTVGHGELNDSELGAEKPEGRSASVVKGLLEQQNYRVKDLGLSEGLANAVPDDADLVLVLGPTLAFLPEELAALRRYAERGGKLLLALDADVQSTRGLVAATGKQPDPSAAPSSTAPSSTAPSSTAPSSAAPSSTAPSELARSKAWLVDLARTVGATFEPSVLADDQSYVVRRNDASDRLILPTNRFSSHASVSTLSRNASRVGVLVMGAAHLLDTEQGPYKPQVALRSMPSTFADDNRDYEFQSTETRRVYNLAVAIAAPATRPDTPTAAASATAAPTDPTKPSEAPAEDEPSAAEEDPDVEDNSEMRAFVLSDADALSDLLMERVVGNQMLLVDAVRWLVGEESLAGEFSTEEDVRIEHTKQQDLAWFYSTIFGIPLLVLVGGTWLSRRARGGSNGSAKGERTRGSGEGAKA